MKKFVIILLFLPFNGNAQTKPDSVRLTYLETQITILKSMIGLNKLEMRDSIKILRNLNAALQTRFDSANAKLETFKLLWVDPNLAEVRNGVLDSLYKPK